MFHHILVCSDGSEQALKAAYKAGELARIFHARLTILTVFNPWTVIAINAQEPADQPLKPNYVEAIEAEIERRTRDAIGQAECRCLREIGHPVDKIVHVALRDQVDLIVLGNRGLGRSQSQLLGSVTEGVIHHAHCPVLMVR
jgi:nucleotide-binding universal stress UspA family protein